jgi:hypothetical protein
MRIIMASVCLAVLALMPLASQINADADVLATAISHYASREDRRRLIVAVETLDARRIQLGYFATQDIPGVPRDLIVAIARRNVTAASVPQMSLPIDSMMVAGAEKLTRRPARSGGDEIDWTPFLAKYPDAWLLQLALPVFDAASTRAAVYFTASGGAEAAEGWVYILEGRGAAWQVVFEGKPWIS